VFTGISIIRSLLKPTFASLRAHVSCVSLGRLFGAQALGSLVTDDSAVRYSGHLYLQHNSVP